MSQVIKAPFEQLEIGTTFTVVGGVFIFQKVNAIEATRVGRHEGPRIMVGPKVVVRPTFQAKDSE